MDNVELIQSLDSRNKILTSILAEANSFYPQDTHLNTTPTSYPVAMKAAYLLLAGNYKGEQISFSDIEGYEPDLQVAIEKTNMSHEKFGIPIIFVTDDKEVGVEKRGDKTVRKQAGSALKGYYRGFAQEAVDYLGNIVSEEATRLGLVFDRHTKPSQIEQYLETNPTLKTQVRQRIQNSLEDIDPEVREYRDSLKNFGNMLTLEAQDFKYEMGKQIGLRIENKLRKYVPNY